MIPPKGSIPPAIRKRKVGINFGINIGGSGMAQPKQQSDNFDGWIKARSKSPQRKRPEEKIDFAEMKKWIIEEISHLMELKKAGKDMSERIKRLLDLAPQTLVEEIMKAAKELSKRPK